MTTPFEGLVALGQWSQHHPQVLLSTLGGAFLLGGVVHVLTGGRRRLGDAHGSARWATFAEVKRSGLSRSHGVVVGTMHGQTFYDNGPTHVFLCGPTRCHAPGTEILMANGQVKLIEHIQVGEQVMGPDSLPRTILALHQGQAEMVRIVPKKGMSFDVSMDHVLVLKRTNARKYLDGIPVTRTDSKQGEIIEISVREWLNRSKTFKHLHKLFRTGVDFPASDALPLHPYLLGVFLGDGHSGPASIDITNANKGRLKRKASEVLVGSPMHISRSFNAPHNNAHHFFIAGRNRKNNPSGKGIPSAKAVNPFVTILKSLRLYRKTAGTKFIPEAYKIASKEDRLHLLAGLIDTDGCLSRHANSRYLAKNYTFVSKSKQLANDVCFVARSLGMAAYVKPQTYTWQNGSGLYYHVSIYGGTHLIPCQIKSKQVRIRKGAWGKAALESQKLAYKYSPLVTGFDIEPVGIGLCYGFTCDGDQRYLMGDFTVTHNSTKGVTHIQPTLRTWRHSALILDPKRGENYDATHDVRAQLGRVERFAPYQSPLAKINVVEAIRFKTLHAFRDALLVAQSLMAPYKLVQENSTSLHFRELAAMLLTAGLLHVCYTVTHPSLAATWHFLTQQHPTLAACLHVMRRTWHTSHGVHPAIAQLTHAIQQITGDRELSSVWTTMVRPLSLYADPLIAASTDTSTVRLEDLQHGTEPLSLYLLAPSPRELERLHPVYRVIVDVAMARLMDRPAGPAPHRLLLCGEELPAHGYMHSLNKGAGDMAGYGIKGLFVAQDLDQFEEVYGKQNTIWGNTDTKIFHAPNNEKTAERLSKFILGAATVANPVLSRQGVLGRGSVSYQVAERPLMTPDEVQALDPARLIVRRTGSKPMLLGKLGYDPSKREEAA